MKWSISKQALLLSLSLLPFPALAQSKHEKQVESYTSFWNNLIPRYTKLQFAGSMGMISAGVGWNYGRDHWETDLLLGIVPRNADRHAMVTMTFKQNYLLTSIPLNNSFSFEPLACGLYLNTLFDDDFWVKNPDKYPKGYYTFSTRVRIHAFVGQRLTLNLDTEKSRNRAITFFYEISTCDLYLIEAFNNSYLKPADYLSLSFGLKVQIL